MSEVAYRHLKGEILTCRLQPGALMVGAEIAQRLGMSRTPVDRALRALCQEGFVTVLPRKGYQVTFVSPRDSRENFELRLSVEVSGAALAAQRASDEALSELKQCHERARARLETPPGAEDPAALEFAIAANREFHVGVAALADNERLVRTVAWLLDEAERTYSLYFQPKPVLTADPHGEILEALAAKDPDAARAAMASHLHDTQEGVAMGARMRGQ